MLYLICNILHIWNRLWGILMIVKANLTEQVYTLLRDKIVQRQLAPGERIHIDALAREWDISRTPIRDALTRLASEGFVTVVARRATFVSRVSAKEFIDLLDLRLGLEMWAARKSCENLDDADLQHLTNLHQQMIEAVAEFDKDPYHQYLSFGRLNQDFHGTIVRAGGNEKLFETYRSVDGATQIQRVIYPVPKEILQQSNIEHGRILEALCKKDWPEVQQAITAHIETVKQDVLRGLELLGESPGGSDR